MTKKRFFLKQRGYTTPEILVGGLVATSLLAATLTGYSHVSHKTEVKAAVTQASELSTAVRQWVQHRPNTGTGDNAEFIASGYAPESVQVLDTNNNRDTNKLGHAKGGGVGVKVLAINDPYRYAISFQGLKSADCKLIVRRAYQGFAETSVCGGVFCDPPGTSNRLSTVAKWDNGITSLDDSALNRYCFDRSNTVTFFN